MSWEVRGADSVVGRVVLNAPRRFGDRPLYQGGEVLQLPQTQSGSAYAPPLRF